MFRCFANMETECMQRNKFKKNVKNYMPSSKNKFYNCRRLYNKHLFFSKSSSSTKIHIKYCAQELFYYESDLYVFVYNVLLHGKF